MKAKFLRFSEVFEYGFTGIGYVHSCAIVSATAFSIPDLTRGGAATETIQPAKPENTYSLTF